VAKLPDSSHDQLQSQALKQVSITEEVAIYQYRPKRNTDKKSIKTEPGLLHNG
jgi:hypothetical protein